MVVVVEVATKEVVMIFEILLLMNRHKIKHGRKTNKKN